MLHYIELENFKAFGARVKIPCAPITLIFGQNSAGKSSILQALNLLKQTCESRDSGAILLPRTDNGIVDLGSFQDMLYDHDLKRSLNVRVIVKVKERRSRHLIHRSLGLRSDTPLLAGIEFSFHRKSIKEEVKLRELQVFLNDCNSSYVSLKPTTPTPRHLFGMTRLRTTSRRFDRTLNVAKITSINNNPIYWRSGYQLYKENIQEIIEGLHNFKLSLEESDARHTRYILNEEGERIRSKEKILRETKKAIDFYSSDFNIEQFSDRMADEFKNAIIGLEGFLPITQNRRSIFRPEIEGLRDSRILRPSFYMRVADPSRLVLNVSNLVNDFFEQLFPLGPSRRSPERWYIFTGTSPQDVGYLGNLLPDLIYRNPSLVRNTNKWLKNLEIGYKISVRSIGARAKDLFEVRLVDTRSEKKVEVSLADVGFGISQLLPFIVQSLASQDQTITIEQPEVHVHPRLQADLGDLMIEAIQEPRNNQFIIETHSEHLILRLLRRIRETSDGELPRGISPLRPDQLSVLYVTRGEDGAEIINLPVTEDGEFDRPWPQGFFADRSRELF